MERVYMLAGHHNEVRLGELKRPVLEHAYLMQQSSPFVSECLVVPDAVWLNFEHLKYLLEAALKNVNHPLVCCILPFYLLCLLLSSVNLAHDFLKLLAALGEIVLRGISDTVVTMPLDLAFEVSDLFDKLLGLRVELRDIVVEGKVLRLCLGKALHDLIQADVLAYSFFDRRQCLLVLLHFLESDMDMPGVTRNAPGCPGNCAPHLLSVRGPRAVLMVLSRLSGPAAALVDIGRLVLGLQRFLHNCVPLLAVVVLNLLEVRLTLLKLGFYLVASGLRLRGLGHDADELLPF